MTILKEGRLRVTFSAMIEISDENAALLKRDEPHYCGNCNGYFDLRNGDPIQKLVEITVTGVVTYVYRVVCPGCMVSVDLKTINPDAPEILEQKFEQGGTQMAA